MDALRLIACAAVMLSLSGCAAQRGTSGFLETKLAARSLAVSPHYGDGAASRIAAGQSLDEIVQCVADTVARQRPQLAVNFALLSPSSNPDPLDVDGWLGAGGPERIARLARILPDDLVALIGFAPPEAASGREVALRAVMINLRDGRLVGGIASRARPAEFFPTLVALDQAACRELGERLAEAVAPPG